MRLESLSPVHVRAAIALYNRHAWPAGGPLRPRASRSAELSAAQTPQEVLSVFEREATGANESCARYSLRLGNQRYPFMKFVVQEHLVKGEYFFCVDTHDNLTVRPNAPDYTAWEELKAFNRRLKQVIEAEWESAGLPTFEDLRLLMLQIATQECETNKRVRLLIVDDEVQVAEGLRVLLEARGYDVELSFDGPSALARLARAPCPDLVLLDCEMPGFDGQEVLRRIREELGLSKLPVLVATAANIDPARVPSACGLLRKPYPRQVLCALLARLVGSQAVSGAPGAPPSSSGTAPGSAS
jgi:CheY-like chemotaxis protein